jgi:phosphoketolase
LEDWLRSYRPEELFDEQGRLKPELAELAPKGERRMGAHGPVWGDDGREIGLHSLNRFMKKLTRERVVPTISARVS